MENNNNHHNHQPHHPRLPELQTQPQPQPQPMQYHNPHAAYFLHHLISQQQPHPLLEYDHYQYPVYNPQYYNQQQQQQQQQVQFHEAQRAAARGINRRRGLENSSGNHVLDHMPPGFRFAPTDEELIQHYLRKKIANNPNDPLPPNRIHEADVYELTPEQLTSQYQSDSLHNSNGWYFFTRLAKKYPNGSRPSRSCSAGGFWKPTGRDQRLKLGWKKSLDYWIGRKPGIKTEWKMHEYRIDEKNPTVNIILCEIYRNKKSKEENKNETVTGESASDDHIVNEASMQNRNGDHHDLVVAGSSSSAGSNYNINHNGTENIYATDGSSDQDVIYDSNISFQSDHSFQEHSQLYSTTNYGGFQGSIAQISQDFADQPSHEYDTMTPSNLNVQEEVPNGSNIGGAIL